MAGMGARQKKKAARKGKSKTKPFLKLKPDGKRRKK